MDAWGTRLRWRLVSHPPSTVGLVYAREDMEIVMRQPYVFTAFVNPPTPFSSNLSDEWQTETWAIHVVLRETSTAAEWERALDVVEALARDVERGGGVLLWEDETGIVVSGLLRSRLEKHTQLDDRTVKSIFEPQGVQVNPRLWERAKEAYAKRYGSAAASSEGAHPG